MLKKKKKSASEFHKIINWSHWQKKKKWSDFQQFPNYLFVWMWFKFKGILIFATVVFHRVEVKLNSFESILIFWLDRFDIFHSRNTRTNTVFRQLGLVLVPSCDGWAITFSALRKASPYFFLFTLVKIVIIVYPNRAIKRKEILKPFKRDFSQKQMENSNANRIRLTPEYFSFA